MARSKKQLGRFVDPRTDFGWKFYFGREDNKVLLIEFLNSLFQGEKIISDLRYKPVLKTVMDQWLYLLKHLSTMDRLPSFLDKRIFGLIFEIGEIGNLTEEELMSYEASLKHRRDAESVFNSAKKSGEALGHAKGLAEGKAEGLLEGERKKALETAKAFKEMGLPIADIAKGTGLSVEEIEKL